jgi:CubicO group peptidase (beta-lactamase class C family)
VRAARISTTGENVPTLNFVITALFVLLLPASSTGATEPDYPLADFDAYVRSALNDWQTPGLAVAVIKDGKVALARGYGTCRSDEERPVDENTIFPISSVTKVFTATCLAMLIEEGKLKWSDPVVGHLPEFELGDPFLTKDVRIEDLLSHRVGLETADLLAYRGDYDRAEILRRLRFLQPVAPFRGRFGYHNHMMTTAGEVVERVGGQPWAIVLRTRLLKPLGMSSTFAGPQELEGRANVSSPHLLTQGKLILDPAWKRGPGYEGFQRLHEAVAPAGGIQSNVVDMAKFVQMYLDEGAVKGQPFLKPQTVRTMLAPHSVMPIKATPQPNFAYPRFFFGGGLGWQLRDYRGRKIVMHGGSSGAVAAMMPEERIGVVVLANRGCGIVYMLMHDIFDRMLGIPRTWTNRDWLVDAEENPAKQAAAKIERLEAARRRDTMPSLPLSKYAGTYECDLYGKLKFLERDDSLRLRFGPNMTATLVHWEHDAFRAKLSFPPGEEWLIRFQVSAGGADRLRVERLYWDEPMPEFRRTE